MIGFLAGATSLPWALAVLIPAALAVLVLARRAASPVRVGGPPTPRATVMGAG